MFGSGNHYCRAVYHVTDRMTEQALDMGLYVVRSCGYLIPRDTDVYCETECSARSVILVSFALCKSTTVTMHTV